MNRRPMDPHDRRGWLVVGVLFVNLAVLYGAWYAYSVYLVALLREFGWSRSVVAGGFSLFLLIHGSLSPVIGLLAARVGPQRLIMLGAFVMSIGLLLAAHISAWWHLYLFYGGICAVGISLSGWLPSVLITRRWFPTRMGTAVGVASAGIGIGISVLVPLAQFLIDHLGWRWTFRIQALMIMGWVIPATWRLIADPAAANTAAASRRPSSTGGGEAYWTLRSALRDGRYWALAGVFFSGNVTTQMLLVHQVAYLVDHGVSPLAAASVSGVVGLASIVGKTAWGTLSDRTGREVAYTLSFSCVVAGVGALVLAGWYPATLLPYVYGVLIGLGYAGTAPLTPAAASDLFSGPGYSVIFGSLHFLLCLGAAVGSWGAGKIFDGTGSYEAALWTALAAALLAPALMWVAAPRRPHPAPPASGQ
ncbi:MAG: MFS transporter [Candidatus Methylomirabilota bacterium]